MKGAAGFVAGLAVWLALAPPYESAVASVSEAVLRLGERPAVTRLTARRGEFVVDRSDFPPAAPRPGLPSADLHFNFVILAALLAALPPARASRIFLAFALLFAVHVVALCCQVESLYATRLGAWSEANYGAFSRNVWASAFHVYQIAGRFAAPFAIWWPLAWREPAEEEVRKGPARRRKKRKG
ncbi:MAG: hypothetical protein LC796_08780 [Acidobacteria bacterium]|nr:hypothetical protein [Acidobacteriota bacterium]MCA1610753.1 hypothetical protein [Acidobacteriota bacterium]